MDGEYANITKVPQPRAGVLLWQVASPLLILLGTFGNILSILVISRSRFNKSSSSTYLLGLAVADLSVIYFGLLPYWVYYTFGLDIKHLSAFMCKVNWWFIYVTGDCSVYILTAITTERLLSTLYPYKSKLLCTKKLAKTVVVVVFTNALLINSHVLYGFGFLEIESENATLVMPCVPISDAYDMFFSTIWTWIDLCKFSLIPFVILTTGNIGIILTVLKSKRKVKSRIFGKTSHGNDMTSNMSALLVSLNCIFILCTLPVCVYQIGQHFWVQEDDPWWAVVNLFMYLNNSVNFFLYCLSGSRFRKEVKDLLSFKSSRVTPATSQQQ